jgi:glycine/D-amino acid oxidase-like deaminating enzyme
VDVLIVGGGVAGLTAAWRLTRAGFSGRLLLVELGDSVGGTSVSATTGESEYPWGAHYITLPNPECRHVRSMLSDFGVIQGFEGTRPRYDPRALCLAPQERLHMAGRWIEGLWPSSGASADDTAQLAAFEALCLEWTHRQGSDGRPAFSIPVAGSSWDPSIRALARQPFDRWLTAQGFDSPRLIWWIDYACRDDYGVPASQVSAWGGLHYFCSRRPDPADALDIGTHVLTWPSGNGFLVQKLLAASRVEVLTGVVARHIEAESGRVVLARGDQAWTVQADAVILAVPGRVRRAMGLPIDGTVPPTASWRVAQLHCDRPPHSVGVGQAWDSVRYEGRGLGVVNSSWQNARYGGPTILSYYEPIADRHSLVDARWKDQVDLVLSDLAPAHRDLRERVQRVDVWHWGHGTVVPAVNLHAGGLEALAKPVGRVHMAHTDLSGLSLFEEASWHGVRAAEEVLAALGRPVETSLL